ncbi:MAG: MMPL family transporter [Clostridium sp.]|uniref:MMPL family transporter n=1 Tax=Clostridium sp. TaxID=1506 RepID=UPI003F3A28A6
MIGSNIKGKNKKIIFSVTALILWGIMVAALLIISPSLTNLVSTKGGIKLPNGYSDRIGEELQNNLKFNSNNTYLAVFHSDNELTKKDKDNIKKTINNISEDKKSIHVTNVLDNFNNPQLDSQLISKDNKTIIAMLTVDPRGATTKEIKDGIESKLKTDGVSTYLTGDKPIESDVNLAAQKGLNKTAGITIVFILIVLIILFRSVVTPFIPLLTVGVSYLASQSVVAILANKYDFPLSNYTQIFMICILFGIGTDYSILILDRFKEELATGEDKYTATMNTFKTAGKTVLFSATPVFVVFASLNFISFNLYRSAVAVAIGIVFLVLGLFTIVPALMMLLGKNIFWPVKSKIKVQENKLWGKLGTFAFERRNLTLAIIGIITIVPILLNNWGESFNNLNEISDTYSSKKGFDIVSDSFGIGKVSPITIYIENDDNLREPEYIALVEKISSNLKANSNIQSVMSVSRPVGNRLDQIYENYQAGQVSSGVNKATSGLNEIKNGLNSANDKIQSSKSKLNVAEKDTTKLQDGTEQTQNGVLELQKALEELNNSINLEHTGASELKAGVVNAKNKLNELKTGQEELQNGYAEVGEDLNKIAAQLNEMNTVKNDLIKVDEKKLKELIGITKSDAERFIKAHPELINDKEFQRFLQDIENLNNNIKSLDIDGINQKYDEIKTYIGKLNELNSDINLLAKSMNELNTKSKEITGGLTEFNKGLSQVENGLDSLNNGLDKSLNGGNEISGKIPEISDALKKIASGQGQIKNGFNEFKGQVNELGKGLSTGASGIGEIENGIKYANGYINDWANLSYNFSGISIPMEIYKNKDFNDALNQYITPDGKLTTIQVMINENPYSDEAVNEIPKIKNIVKYSVEGTKLENANIGVGGIASTTYQTKVMAKADYNKALIFVVIGVFMVLVVILKSLVMPTYLVASLVLTYFTSLSLVQIIVQKIMGYPGISWITSFFGFVVLMALGIDYSIFIMTRFNQYEDTDIKDRMIKTMKIIGGVIMSAVIILSGTFAALIPSGVLSLVEIAMVVLTGIILYVAVILPLFIPAMVRIFGKYNWWPFKNIKKEIKKVKKLKKGNDEKINN